MGIETGDRHGTWRAAIVMKDIDGRWSWEIETGYIHWRWEIEIGDGDGRGMRNGDR